ncbi:uncharacterized protein BJ171DRAFT_229118 [Polychytrium aggregatum]|uniref:uncharacterized protein n=1 Tax=Polychytrium aggregatum TaxID=110093 RepID=UPI0022FF1E6A|nr:uncharacterized protein BJ171DRAFT_229118 [Polychytrium aggregatum]KAI9197175.1 hypothetical protein BJ171DRAFT_229118 [Polychytrium aggregatum]
MLKIVFSLSPCLQRQTVSSASAENLSPSKPAMTIQTGRAPLKIPIMGKPATALSPRAGSPGLSKIGQKSGGLFSMGASSPGPSKLGFFAKGSSAKTPTVKSKVVFDDGDEVGEVQHKKKASNIDLMMVDDFADTPIHPAEPDVSVFADMDDAPAPERPSAASMQVDEVDPLDAYMVDVESEARKMLEEDREARKNKSWKKGELQEDVEAGADVTDVRRIEDNDEEDIGSDPEDIIAAAAKRLAAKKKDLAPVNHSTMNYESFRRNFFIEPPEMADMTPAEVDMKRLELDGIKIRGVNCPKPIEKWTQFGLPHGVYEVIRKVLKYDKPSSIQAQSIPAIMSGRDVIGIAKTGSGKTIAFLLPMFRHIADQRPLEAMEGPIALIMTPTRELAVQIHKECKHFAKALNLRAVCAYGGSPIKDQIADLKRGAEIIICTPGRMIDLLCANSGRVTNLKRVTYLVLDEADRMFDMGFEPQVMRIVNNIRPSRQTVLFSATFPRQMEALARKILQKPLEITVGGRSVVCADVTQHVEIRDDDAKFVRLLEILGLSMAQDPDGKVLIFVDRQEAADNLLRDLFRRGYPCQSLHGGKDQADRDSTIVDFKTGDTNVLIATSVAARGLDVKQLKVVVNYDCPNHMEDYVHRVGRTGRAGNKGTSYTFITREQDRYAVDIVKALKMSNAPVPDDVQTLANEFMEKVKSGNAKYTGSGFGGKGLEKLDKERDIVKKIQKKSHGGVYAEDEEEEEDGHEITLQVKAVQVNGVKVAGDGAAAETQPSAAGAAGSATASGASTAVGAGAAAATATAGGATAAPVSAAALAALKAAQKAAEIINAQVGASGRKARDVIAEINSKFGKDTLGHSAVGSGDDGVRRTGAEASAAPFSCEIEINDYPQRARWKVTNKEQITLIGEISGAAITTRGQFFEAGKQPGPNERKLYLVCISGSGARNGVMNRGMAGAGVLVYTPDYAAQRVSVLVGWSACWMPVGVPVGLLG